MRPGLTPAANALIQRIRLRRMLGKLVYSVIPEEARRNRLIHDFTFRKDADAVSFPFAITQGKLPDLKAPKTWAEKVRWTFLHHRNPLMSLVSDKIAVRGYLALKGARIAPPKLFATGWQPEDILQMDLPERFALKASNSCGANLFHTGPNPPDRQALLRQLQIWRENGHWRRHGELFYRDIPWRFLVEELLPSDQRQLEYKVVCFHGDPVWVSVVSSRGSAGITRSVHFPDWSVIPFGTRGIKSSPTPAERPEALDLLLTEARRLSADFMHVRVDFLHYNDRLVFSELTISNNGMRSPIDPPDKDLWLGNHMDLSREAEYARLGQDIARQLAWPPSPPKADGRRSN